MPPKSTPNPCGCEEHTFMCPICRAPAPERTQRVNCGSSRCTRTYTTRLFFHNPECVRCQNKHKLRGIFGTGRNPQTSHPPPKENELELPERRYERMAFQEIADWTQYRKGPMWHPRAHDLSNLGYHEPRRWEFWRSNPTTDRATMESRYDQAKEDAGDWPLPLPYEPWHWFVGRVSAKLFINNMVLFDNQFQWRQTYDRRMRYPGLDDLEDFEDE